MKATAVVRSEVARYGPPQEGQIVGFKNIMAEEQYRDQLVQEFQDEANDVLSEFDLSLVKLSAPGAEVVSEFSRLFGAFSVLRLQGRFMENPYLDIAFHRLCDYLEDLTTPSEKVFADLQFYSATLQDLLSGKNNASDVGAFARTLPVRTPADLGNIVQVDVEIMLVEPNKTVSKLVSRELRACGYRVTTLRDPIEALTYAFRTKPDMITASAELPEISGIDLACAIEAMPVTHKIPFAVLTSRDRGHAALANLPTSTAVIKKGAKFGDDLADALMQFGIT